MSIIHIFEAIQLNTKYGNIVNGKYSVKAVLCA